MILFFCLIGAAYSIDIKLDDLKVDNETVYLIRLKNGDILTGLLVDIINDEKKGNAIKLQTMIGNPIVYLSEISYLEEKGNYNRHKHRAFILPTAEPIGKDHFAGNYELLFFYAGFGIMDYFSVTAGRSAIPNAVSGDQISVLNLKATIINLEWDNYPGGMTVGLGTNIGFINDRNRIVNYYTNFTFHIDRTYLTAAIYTKQGGDDFYTAYFQNEKYDFMYQNGSFGLALGLTTKFSERHDLYFVGELWNSDFTKLTNTGILGALRIGNSSFAADFGLIFFTQPMILPVVNFVWTPF